MYVKTLGKITSLYKLGDMAACRRNARCCGAFLSTTCCHIT